MNNASAVRGSVLVTALAIVALIFINEALPSTAPAQIELDAVVVNGDDEPVRGLRQQDFQVREDGRPVAVTSFREVSAAGISGAEDGRSLVLMLDDTGVGPLATTIVQNIARLFLARARRADAIAVVRLTHHDDEVVMPPELAVERVDEYRAKSVPYFGVETIQESLEAFARIAQQLDPIAHRRKTVVCVGRRSLCDLFLEVPQDSLVWSAWRQAISAMARANVSVYVVDPAGVTGRIDLGAGLVDLTGGDDFVRSNNFARAADLIWNQAGHCYLLGYVSAARTRDLHSIDVRVRRAGVHVLARKWRGD